MQKYDVIILGAGGAGLMCAGVAGQAGLQVCVIDHADKPGKKILISGGGRCNFTNLNPEPSRFLSENQHFAKSALSRYTAQDFIDLVDRHKIAWHEKTLGQLFCDGSARQIVKMLLDECPPNVDVKLSTKIGEITHSAGQFTLNGMTAPNLVLATGGPSIPKMGATGIAYDIARQFGLGIITPRPALVPFTLGAQDIVFKELSGVAIPSITSLDRTSFEEATLFTHKGLSGPAILQISSYWSQGQSIRINLTPEANPNWLIDFKRENPRSHLRAALRSELPARLADTLDAKFNLTGQLANIKDEILNGVTDKLSAWQVTPTGTEGFPKAEVTAGGIDTNALSSKTMEAKSHPGLYAIGESVDVTGWLGGYNFQWAWSSAQAAATHMAEKAN